MEYIELAAVEVVAAVVAVEVAVVEVGALGGSGLGVVAGRGVSLSSAAGDSPLMPPDVLEATPLNLSRDSLAHGAVVVVVVVVVVVGGYWVDLDVAG